MTDRSASAVGQSRRFRDADDPAKTRKDAFLKFVPSGVATVAELQGKGFAYLKVG